MGIDDIYGCFVDEENGGPCVLDDDNDGTIDDCIIAQGLVYEGKHKGYCKYWRSTTGDPWNDGLEFAINRAEFMCDKLVEEGRVNQAQAINLLIDALEVYVD